MDRVRGGPLHRSRLDLTALLQLDPPIPVLAHVKGEWTKGMAHVLIDYGYEFNLSWVVFGDESRECWTLTNANIRAQDNITAGRIPTHPGDVL